MNTKQIERRYDLLRTLTAIGIALVLALMVVALISQDPVDAMTKFLIGPLSSFRRFANVIEVAAGVNLPWDGTPQQFQWREN